MQKYAEQMIDGLKSGRFVDKTAGGVNVSDVFNWYSFDVMGDLAFGRSFSRNP